MQYALAMLEAGNEIQRWPIDIDEVIIGRSDKADVVIDGGSISRQHVRLWLEDGIVAAEDLGSRNGIKINGVRTRSGSLQNGDQMEVGKHFFVVTSREAAPVSLDKNQAPAQAPNPERRAVQKRALQNPDARLNATLAYAGRLQPYLFDSDTLLKHMMKIIMDDIPAQRCFILARPPGGRGLIAISQASKSGTGDGPALNTTIVDHVFRERKPIIAGDVSEVPTVSSGTDPKPGTIATPLISENKTIGVLYVDSAWDNSRFVAANLEDMKAYGLAFGTLVEHTTRIKQQLAEAELSGVTQATTALGKCLYEQLHEIRESAGDTQDKSFDRIMRRTDQAVQQMIGLANIHLTSRHPVEINTIIEKAIADLKKDADAKSVSIQFKNESSVIVFGDSHQLHRVVYALLATSIDSCKPAESAIAITTENKTDACHIILRDNGKGMSPMQCESLTDNVVANVGLGMNGIMLAHAFAVIKSHGGTISVQSEEDKGTAFTIKLPQQQRAAVT